MRILFLNQYFPPDPAPTGTLLRELGDFLATRGHEVSYIASPQNYRSARKDRGRMRRELAALGSIFWRGLRSPRPDIVFSTTSPPLLLLVATFIASRHRARSIHWLMDMYPELALELGELRPGPLARVLEKAIGWAYRRTDRLVALDRDMAHRLEKYGAKAETMTPWLLAPFHHGDLVPATEPPTWIYSGNLGRAHEWETLLAVQAILEREGSAWRLLFQGGGPARAAAEARAVELGLQRCEWQPYVDEEALRVSLQRGQVLVATQRPETQGLLWPSKLALMRDLGRPILWIGPTRGAIADLLRESPESGVFAPGDAHAIAQWMLSRPLDGTNFRAPGLSAQAERAASFERWARWVESIA